MPTLQEVTAAHSQRLSALHQRRDHGLREALVTRDSELRALAAAAPAYARFDKAAISALEDRTAIEYKAAAARETALARAVDERAGTLAHAHMTRKAADLAALDTRMQAEAAAETKYRDAIAALAATLPLETRQRTTRDAERLRRHEMDAARTEYASAITASQGAYRESIDGALIEERKGERQAAHAYQAARRVAAASEAAAVATADRQLLLSLAAIPAAEEALQRYRDTVSRLRTEADQEERALFERFRHELSLIT